MRGEDDHERLAIHGHVFGPVEIIGDPEARNVEAILEGMRTRRVVVGPEQAELQQRTVAGIEVAVVQRVLELPAAARPVPVVNKKRDAVLDRPFDVPVGDLRLAFAIPAQHRSALGKALDRLPLAGGLPAGKVINANLERPAHGLWLWAHSRVARLLGSP